MDEGIAFAENNDRFYLAELYRLRGELCGQAGDGPGAAAAFRAAIDVARQQGAKNLERKAIESRERWAAR